MKDMWYIEFGREKMDKGFAQLELYVLLHQQKGQWVDTRSDEFWELKANTECHHIETALLMQTDEQLMFQSVGGNNKGHVYCLGPQSIAITTEQWVGNNSSSSVPSVSSTTAHDACIKREKRLWGYMQQAQDKFVGFMTSFAS
ncbi:hypothetical protein M9H77_17547 [Catharanthus roseus]|uniref:Uncharacterized protein n=1 Tax=Catharanthus roseus TaxID=4058 RepID=A0ACC0B4X2_CATRO|nr:hypothetical protein M9H77_17547 [Catharanthus roseus]